MALDSQQIELVGRNLLIAALMADGLEVAVPQRDRGVDLIVYADLDESQRFLARPIQLKTASGRAFGIDQKYAKFPELLLVYVWNVAADAGDVEMFCLSHAEAERIGSELGWTATKSWEKGAYTTSKPSTRLGELLEPYRMGPTRWAAQLGASGTRHAELSDDQSFSQATPSLSRSSDADPSL